MTGWDAQLSLRSRLLTKVLGTMHSMILDVGALQVGWETLDGRGPTRSGWLIRVAVAKD